MRSSHSVSVGNAGPTKAVIAEVDRALAKHELIKVKIQADDRELRKEIGDELGARRRRGGGASRRQDRDPVPPEAG